MDVQGSVDTLKSDWNQNSLSFPRKHPQKDDQIPEFWNNFTQNTQQVLCSSNSYLNRPKKKKTKKQTQQPLCSSDLNK